MIDKFIVKANPFDLKSNTLANLEQLTASYKNNAKDLNQAIDKLSDSLNPKYWQADHIHLVVNKGEKVFDFEKQSVQKLMEIIDDGRESASFNSVIQTSINSMVQADNTLATVAINDASQVSGDDAQKKVAQAQLEMIKAAQAVSSGHYDDAINHYKNAWELAQQAIYGNDGHGDSNHGNDGHGDNHQ